MNHIYPMEELVPIVGQLADKYTAKESTSVTYEIAEQLMGSVLYCIQETRRRDRQTTATAGETSAGKAPVSTEDPPAEKISAQQAYETGASCVRAKTREALTKYNNILPTFNSYGSQCLYDVFVKGLPEFFRWYDIPFNPQNTILTLDYPILKDVPEDTGIDRIYNFISCIEIEQMFLCHFPEEYVKKILRRYHSEYEELPENICEILLLTVIGHILAETPLSKQDFSAQDYTKIKKLCLHTEHDLIVEQLKQAFLLFLEQYFADSTELFDYFQTSIANLAVRIKHASEHASLHSLL